MLQNQARGCVPSEKPNMKAEVVSRQSMRQHKLKGDIAQLEGFQATKHVTHRHDNDEDATLTAQELEKTCETVATSRSNG